MRSACADGAALAVVIEDMRYYYGMPKVCLPPSTHGSNSRGSNRQRSTPLWSIPHRLVARAIISCTIAAAALAGCVAVRPAAETAQPTSPQHAKREPGRYVVTRGQFTESVSELRAAPPPDLAEVTEGTTIRADERKLAARSFVRIGTGCYRSDNDAARDWTLRNGTRVGAEKILLYTLPADPKAAEAFAGEAGTACAEDGAAADGENWPFVAAFYVRYRLPFGAQFRSMTAAEVKTVGVEGGVQLGAIVNGTPAAEANLRSGDFVVKFNGAPVRNRDAFQELLRANMGKRVTLTVARNGDQFDRIVRLGVIATPSER